MNKRKANLDLLRAIAISAVIFFHISQYIETLSPGWHHIFSIGAYGVDIFFLLSGWLIGGIFFREYNSFQQVSFTRFWSRRWLRTLPPYYVALLISWYAVYLSRGEKFDIGYLFFLQNYYDTLPFFKISWSLCVEEHFYLLLPPLFYASLKYNIVIGTCLALTLVSLLCRLSYDLSQFPGFGFLTTATHLRLDGLTLGVLCSFIYTSKRQWWAKFSMTMKALGFLCGPVTLYFFMSNNDLAYSAGLFTLSIFFCGALCVFVDAPDWKIAKLQVVYTIAISSYSLYLTHALVINVMERIFKFQGTIFALCTFVAVLLSGYCFHRLIERPSIKVRDYLSLN